MVSTNVKAQNPIGQHDPDNTSPAISWEEFETEYLTREDGFKYEWVRGQVVKTNRSMNQSQYFILKNLEKLFNQLYATGKVSGELMVEVDTFFLKNAHRRPDMAWFTTEQAAKMAYGQNQVPAFVIEIISKNDIADDLLDKLDDYSEAGVKVIWLISPTLQQVHVYSESKKTICKGDMPCSAAPVLPHLQIAVSELFMKPALPVE